MKIIFKKDVFLEFMKSIYNYDNIDRDIKKSALIIVSFILFIIFFPVITVLALLYAIKFDY